MSSNNSKMSVTQLTLLTALNMMGSGIIMLPTKLAQVGTFSVVSWLVTATGSTAMAYAFAKCGMFSKNKGGMGGYAEYVFGKAGSFMANYTYSVSLLIANIAIALSAVGYGVAFVGAELSPVETCIATIATLWICTVLNFKGASITGLISNFTCWGVIIPIAFISTCGWFWFSGDMYVNSWNPHNIPVFDAVSASISMTLWAFLGLESACANSEAVENPEKNVPRAVMAATIGACSGSLLSWQFTIARVFKSSADEGYFPHWFSIVTKDDAPVVGMTIITVIQSLMSLMTISPSLYKQFNTLVDLAVVTNIMPYLLSMGAVAVMMKREKCPANQVGVIKFAAMVGSIYSLYALYAAGFEAMMYGSLVTFLGWTLYGIAADHLEKKSAA